MFVVHERREVSMGKALLAQRRSFRTKSGEGRWKECVGLMCCVYSETLLCVEDVGLQFGKKCLKYPGKNSVKMTLKQAAENQGASVGIAITSS